MCLSCLRIKVKAYTKSKKTRGQPGSRLQEVYVSVIGCLRHRVKDLQGSTTKRVKGVEDLNIRITRAQGIVGVGATIRTPISSYPAAASRPTASIGLPADPASSCPCECSHASSGACCWKG